MSVQELFSAFTAKKYEDQAKAFLNAYWEEHEKDAEKIWEYWNIFIELDEKNGKEGKDLDEFLAHRFLEKIGETKSVKQMRQELTEADLDFNRRLALIEYCLYKFQKKIEDFVKRPQEGDPEARKKIENLQNLLIQTQKALEEAIQTKKEAAKAEQELKVAVKELQEQENAYNSKTEELKKKSETGGVVSRNKAKAELAQHLGKDPLPLSRAKLTTEAAKKKAERTKIAAEEKIKEAEEGIKKTTEEIGILKASAKAGLGSLWFVERELEEAKKYMPKSKGGTWNTSLTK